jgi:outer membrane lipoprotein carrier protein
MLRFLAAAIMAGTAACAQATANEAPATERATAVLDHFVHEVESLQAKFSQSLVDADGLVTEESLGRLVIRRPGKFLWHYSEPYEQVLLADGTNLWSYDVDLEQVTVRPQAEVLASTPALLLGGSDAALADFEIVDAFDDNAIFWIRLQPVRDDAGFTGLELGFDGMTISRMMFFDSLGQTTLIALHDAEVNTPVDDGVFRFEVPPGVDVVGNPEREVAE